MWGDILRSDSLGQVCQLFCWVTTIDGKQFINKQRILAVVILTVFNFVACACKPVLLIIILLWNQ